MIDIGICEDSSIEPYYPQVRDRDDISVLKCKKSGVIFLSRSEHMNVSYYEEKEGFRYWSAGDRKHAVNIGHEDKLRRKELLQHIVTNRKWMDIGTGSGGILDELSILASKVLAVEPQKIARDSLKKLGYDVYPDIESVTESEIDVITLFHVFEHFTKPLEDLCIAGDISFGEAKTAVSGANAQEFEMKDIDGDGKLDWAWRDSSGNLKYSLQSSGIPTEGLVAYYPFNGNANDESGNGNDGTENEATLTADRLGNENRAYSFNGNNYIKVTSSSLFNSQNLSVSAWIYIDQSLGEEQRRIVNRQESNSKSWGLEVFGTNYGGSNDTQIVFHAGNGTTNVNCLGETDLQLNRWYHVVGVHNTINSKIRIYVDSILEKECDSQGLIADITSDIVIGRECSTTKHWFGKIDSVRVYKRSISELEIQALYHEGGWGAN